MNKSFKLNNGKKIEENGKPYFIAELNSSHFGNLDYAEEMIRAVKNAGADCVKFQIYCVKRNCHYIVNRHVNL